MSKEEEVCANCAIPALDDVKLKKCACELVKYCSVECQKNHRSRHKKACKQRMTEIRDDLLFTQPDGSHRGECPICFLPMPLGGQKRGFWACCSKLICEGCVYVHYVKNGNSNCPFCRELAVGEEECRKRVMERIKANDPAAMRQMGTERYNDEDYDSAFEYWTMAAELGDAESHYQLSAMCWKGCGVEKDEEKAIHHWEKAAMGGHPYARYNLGCYEEGNGNIERAVKHYIIAAKLGLEKSMKELWEYYSAGHITKEELEATLRTHKAAIDEMKSPEREKAEKLI